MAPPPRLLAHVSVRPSRAEPSQGQASRARAKRAESPLLPPPPSLLPLPLLVPSPEIALLAVVERRLCVGAAAAAVNESRESVSVSVCSS